MGEPVKRHHLRIVEDSDEELRNYLNMRSRVQLFMKKRHAFVGYTHSNGNFERISPEEILSFPLPLYVLEDALDKFKNSVKDSMGNFPRMIRVYEELSYPLKLELIR